MSGWTIRPVAFAGIAAAMLAATVSAAPNVTAKAHTHTNHSGTHAAGQKAHTGGAGQRTSEVAALQRVHALLASADHDYEGHRAKAQAHVTQAIHELSGQHHQGDRTAGAGAGVGGAGVGAKGGAVAGGAAKGNVKGNALKEPQAQSDAQLKQALQILSGLHGNAANQKVAGHIQSAMTELNTALKIR